MTTQPKSWWQRHVVDDDPETLEEYLDKSARESDGAMTFVVILLVMTAISVAMLLYMGSKGA